jgi:hypothetical protein
MVTKTVPRNTLFSWSCNFDVDIDGNIVTVYFHTDTDSWKIQLDPATVAMAKGLRNQILAWMNQSDTWSGTVVEHWVLQDVVTPELTKKDWVKVP